MSEEKELFQVEVNGEGVQYIRRIYRLSKVLFVAGILVEMIILYFATRNYIRNRNITEVEDPFYYWDLRIYSVYVLLYFFLFILQMVYFFEFTRQAHKAITAGEAQLFNRSFKWLYKNMQVAAVLLVLNALFYFYSLLYNR